MRKHVRGSRAVGGGAWFFSLCGDRTIKRKASAYVAPVYTDCKRCRRIVVRIFGKTTFQDSSSR
jgi:hypothetical protein